MPIASLRIVSGEHRYVEARKLFMEDDHGYMVQDHMKAFKKRPMSKNLKFVTTTIKSIEHDLNYASFNLILVSANPETDLFVQHFARLYNGPAQHINTNPEHSPNA